MLALYADNLCHVISVWSVPCRSRTPPVGVASLHVRRTSGSTRLPSTRAVISESIFACHSNFSLYRLHPPPFTYPFNVDEVLGRLPAQAVWPDFVQWLTRAATCGDMASHTWSATPWCVAPTFYAVQECCCRPVQVGHCRVARGMRVACVIQPYFLVEGLEPIGVCRLCLGSAAPSMRMLAHCCRSDLVLEPLDVRGGRKSVRRSAYEARTACTHITPYGVQSWWGWEVSGGRAPSWASLVVYNSRSVTSEVMTSNVLPHLSAGVLHYVF